VFVSREAAILAQNALETVWRPGSAWTRWGSHSAAPDSLAEFRGGRDGRGKRQAKGRARGYIKGRREDGSEEKERGGGGRKQGKVGLCPNRN